MRLLRCSLFVASLTLALVGQSQAQPRNEPIPQHESLPEALSRLERALDRSFKAAAAGIERGRQAAEHGARAGAAAAARGIERGAHAAARAAERAARELERATSPAPPPGSERTRDPAHPQGRGYGDA
jgi:hypothetical protein